MSSLPSVSSTVSKSNDLISASYSLTVREQRLILAALSTIDPREKMPEQIVITADYYKAVFGSSNPYRDMQIAAEALYDRSVRLQTESEKGDVRWLAEKWTSHTDGKSGGHVRLVFTRAISVYLSELRKRFTTYAIHRIAKLETVYAFRIFEMLVRFSDTGWHRVSIPDLAKMLELPKSYQRASNLKARVLEVAKREINESSGMKIEYEIIYKKGKATHVDFKIDDEVKKAKIQPATDEGAKEEGQSEGEQGDNHPGNAPSSNSGTAAAEKPASAPPGNRRDPKARSSGNSGNGNSQGTAHLEIDEKNFDAEKHRERYLEERAKMQEMLGKSGLKLKGV